MVATLSSLLEWMEGVVPGSRLSLAEREEIAVGRAAKESVRVIAARMGRSPSTVSRELRRNVSGSPRRYRAVPAHACARGRAARPKRYKLVPGSPVRQVVVDLLEQDWSPEQISGWLRRVFPDDPEWQVSHETIYQALYVQGRGGLRRELEREVRTRRRARKPRGSDRTRERGKIPEMTPITARPSEVADRAVPGHWEGDLIVGAVNRSAICSLVERTTRFTLLVAVPGSRRAELVAAAISRHLGSLPEQLRRSLTWDQGREMARHRQITIASGIQVYFCDPHSPWQRPSNENTNGLVRYYYPKSTDFATITQTDLDTVAAKLNTRPRKVLDYRTPAECFNDLLVATAS